MLVNQYIECRPGTCPASTVNRPTIDNNHVDGAFYLDLGGSYEVRDVLAMPRHIAITAIATTTPIVVVLLVNRGLGAGA